MPDFDAERRLQAEQIRARLREIAETIYEQRMPIGRIQSVVTGTGRGPERMPRSGWKPFPMHGRWGGFDQTTWFRMTVRVPESMQGRRVVALVRPGGESLAYVKGEPFQGLDLNRDELYLTDKARGGETFEIVLESVPSVRFDVHHYFEYADLAVMNPAPWDFYYDCQVLLDVCEQLDPNYAPRREMMSLLLNTMQFVDMQHKGGPAYFRSLIRARELMGLWRKKFEASYGLGNLTLTGQSHIDTAWLWPLRETRRKCARTFSTVLNYMERYPEFVYMASQPVQYEWIEQHYPELFARIKARVKEGRWEPFGGMWVECDCNVPSGESLVRQLVYGNRWFREHFGVQSRTAWLPDAFGYSWALPQILKKAQVDTFVTTKISWSRYTDFPYSAFEWEGADGTRVLGLMPPGNYNGNIIPQDLLDHWKKFKQKERIGEAPFPYGWGDGGGGPTLEMLEYGRRLGNIVGMPKCSHGRMQDCIDRIIEQAQYADLPVYNNELYLEYHRGCQTTQARTKRNNRKCEFLLRQAELIGSMSLAHGGPYNAEKLHDAWKIVLTNQFHDILPGSSVHEVYVQTEIDYAEAKKLAAEARAEALAHLGSKIDTSGEGEAIMVFNTLSWVRDDVAHVSLPLPKGGFHVRDQAGKTVPHQAVGPSDLLFEVHDLPPLGYAVYRLVEGKAEVKNTGLRVSPRRLENNFLRVKLDKQGALTSVYDKTEEREIIPAGEQANVLQLFEDLPHGDDAWDIDPNFEDVMWEPGPAQAAVAEQGPLRASVRFVRKTERSVITQEVTMHANAPRVDFVTHVDWREKRVLLKAAFPVDVRSSRASYEIQFAAIERATHHNTDFDRARFEVPAHKWADLSEGDYGVCLLNDCKYGYDIKGNVTRMSLLRSPVDPDPTADECEHQFTYSLYPHAWTWRNGTVQQAYQLNERVLALAAPGRKGPLSPTGCFAAVDADNVVIDTVKKCEDSKALIVRLYEAYGQRGEVAVTFWRKPRSVFECDLMEENNTPLNIDANTVRLYVKPFEIRSLKVKF